MFLRAVAGYAIELGNVTSASAVLEPIVGALQRARWTRAHAPFCAGGAAGLAGACVALIALHAA